MSATTASIDLRSSAAQPGFGAVLRSEWTKLRSVRSTWIMVSLAIGLSVGFSALLALVSGLTHDSWSDGIRAQFDPILNTMGGWAFGMVVVIVLGVTSVTSEYNSRMVRTTFILNPQRNRVFAARAIVVGLLGMAVSAILIPTMFLVCQVTYRVYGLETVSVTDHEAVRFLLVAGLLLGLHHSLISFAIAWLLRGTASAITAAIGFSVLPWVIAPLMPLWVRENVLRYLPDNAKDSLVGQVKPGDLTYLGHTSAILVIAVWIVGLLAAAVVALNRRDV